MEVRREHTAHRRGVGPNPFMEPTSSPIFLKQSRSELLEVKDALEVLVNVRITVDADSTVRGYIPADHTLVPTG